MTSPIDRLEAALWEACVNQRTAPDWEAVDRWQTDELSHLRERFVVQPMPVMLADLVQDALAQWQERERKSCVRLGMTREQFLCEFESLREDYNTGGRA